LIGKKQFLQLINFKTILKLLKLCFPHLRFVIPSLRATRKCIAVSNVNFGKQHMKNGPENAFRHALWVYLIAQYCSYKTKRNGKALHWAIAITSMHEEVFPNEPLERAMDLHNNNIGKKLYMQSHSFTLDEIENILKKGIHDAIRIKSISELKNLENTLVYID